MTPGIQQPVASRHSPHRGFTLIELLLVMSLVGILSSFVLPSIISISHGANLNAAGQMVADQLALARQEAVSKNRDMEVRFYRLADGGAASWRALQLLRIEQSGTGAITVASSRLCTLPKGIEIADDTLSPLISSSSRSGTAALPAQGSVAYRAFRFRADGSLEATAGNHHYLTLVSAADSANPPANYYTIQISPLTGKVSVFRP